MRPQGLVRSVKPLVESRNVLLVVLPKDPLLGLTHLGFHLLQVVLCDVPMLFNYPLQAPCPLAISFVVDWVEDLALGV